MNSYLFAAIHVNPEIFNSAGTGNCNEKLQDAQKISIEYSITFYIYTWSESSK